MSKRSQSSSDEEGVAMTDLVTKRRRHVRFQPRPDFISQQETDPVAASFSGTPNTENTAPESKTNGKTFSISAWKTRAKVTQKHETNLEGKLFDALIEEINGSSPDFDSRDKDTTKVTGDERTSGEHGEELAENDCFYTLPHSCIDVIPGSYHQGDYRFSNRTRGRQCVPNSLISIVYNYRKQVHFWTRWDLDRILEHGDALYKSLQASPSIRNEYLLVEELPSEIELENKMYILEYSDPLVGLLNTSEGKNETSGLAYDLKSAILKTFKSSNACFISFGGNTQSILKHAFKYYLFDPHSRNPKTGMLSSKGNSVLVRKKGIGDLVEHIQALGRSMRVSRQTQFEITGVIVYKSDT